MMHLSVVSDPASAATPNPTPSGETLLRALKQIVDCHFISCSAATLLASACSSFEQCVLESIPCLFLSSSARTHIHSRFPGMPQIVLPKSQLLIQVIKTIPSILMQSASLSASDRRGSLGVSSRVGGGIAATKLSKKDPIKVLFVTDLHILSRQAQLELSLLLLSDAYSIPTIFIVTGVDHPLQSLRYSLRGKFRISTTIGSGQLMELLNTRFVNRIEQDRLEHLRRSIEEPGTVEFCLELQAYVHDVVFGLRNQPDGTCGSVRFPASTLKTLSRAVASIAGRDFAVPEDVHDAALLFLPLAFRSSQVQISDILNV